MNRRHGIIFAYEQRGELRELTERRTAASMPFGGRYRAVDFVLSNLLNAGVTDVGMVLHGRYQSMLDHVGSGKVWDMSRKRGGLHLLPMEMSGMVVYLSFGLEVGWPGWSS